MRILVAFVSFVAACQCDKTPDPVPDAAACVACDPMQTTGGPCTPSRCAKAGDKFCCVF